MRIVWLGPMVFALALSTLALAPRVARGQSQGWSQPIQVSETGRVSWFSDIATDMTGRVHLVWSSGEGLYDTAMYSTNAGVDLTDRMIQPVDVGAIQMPVAGESEVTRPSIIADSKGQVHLTYRAFPVLYQRAPARLASRPQAWTPEQVLNTDQPAYFSRLAFDSKGRLHLIYTQNDFSIDCPICYHLYYRSSADGGNSWSAPLDISVLQTGSAKPQIIVDRQDNIHVVWESGYGGTLGQLKDPTIALYTMSSDSGETWSAPFQFTTGAPDSQGKNPAIAQDGEGKLIAVWLGAPEQVIYYQISRDNGRAWSAPQRIPRVFSTGQFGLLDSYSLSTDSAGNVHLVMAGRLGEDQQNLSLLHLVWNGTSWSEPARIVNYPNGDVPEWPRIAIGLGNQLHVTWFTRNAANARSNSATTDYRVWYARAASGAPAVQSVPYPTPAPTAQPTPSEQTRPAEPTLPPVGNSVPIQSTATLANEMDEIGLLLLSAVPVLVLVGSVLIFLRWRSAR